MAFFGARTISRSLHSVDVLLCALADIRYDARTRNLARALVADGLIVGVIAAGEASDVPQCTLFSWSDPGGRALRRWWSFSRHCAQTDVHARCVIAMDLFALAAASRIAKRCKASLVYDMREFYFALGPLEGKGIRQRILTAHERRQLRGVDDVLVSGELDADIVGSTFGLPYRPFVLLNTPPYRDVVSSPLRAACAVDAGTFLALYQGVVHHGRGLAPFLRAMPLMPDVHLAVIGDGPARPELVQLAASLGISDRVTWLGAIAYDELHAYTCGADVGLCMIEPVSLSYEYALPNKLFEYMMARIPSIVTDLPALRAHIAAYPVGALVNRALSVDAVVAAVASLRSSDVRRGMIAACEQIHALSYEQQQRAAVVRIRQHCP